MELDLRLKVRITYQDIDDIMCTALEGGITYWCGAVDVIGDYLGEYAHEQISKGGELKLYDVEEEVTHILNGDKLMKGIELYLTNPRPYNILEDTKGGLELDTSMVDAEVADMIIQYALFGEVVYG